MCIAFVKGSRNLQAGEPPNGPKVLKCTKQSVLCHGATVIYVHGERCFFPKEHGLWSSSSGFFCSTCLTTWLPRATKKVSTARFLHSVWDWVRAPPPQILTCNRFHAATVCASSWAGCTQLQGEFTSSRQWLQLDNGPDHPSKWALMLIMCHQLQVLLWSVSLMAS